MSTAAPGPVAAVRLGPGEFLLASERVDAGLCFAVDAAVYEVVGEPELAGAGRYLARVRQTDGPGAGGEFEVQVYVGRRVE